MCWLPDPRVRRIGRDEVDVWLVHLDVLEGLAAGMLTTLSSDERARARRMRSPREGRHRALSRSSLRMILGGYLGRPPATLRFRPEPGGRPVLDPPTELTFSAAHAGCVGLVAVARGRAVGVDLEPLSAAPQVAEIADRYLPGDRVRDIRATAPTERDEAWVRLWTEVEACAKVDGRGLGELDPATAAALLADGGHRVQFRPEVGHVATLAYRGRAARVSCFVFDPAARSLAGAAAG